MVYGHCKESNKRSALNPEWLGHGTLTYHQRQLGQLQDTENKYSERWGRGEKRGKSREVRKYRACMCTGDTAAGAGEV